MADELFWAEVWVKVAFACFLFIVGIIFVKRGLSEEDSKGQKYFKTGLAMFAILSGFTRVFFLVSDFQVVGTDIYIIFWKMAVFSSLLALTFITIVAETYLVKSKYVFSIIAVIGIIVLMSVDVTMAQTLMFPFYAVLAAEVFILYLYVAYKSPGSLRTKALFMFVGLLIFAAGIIFDSQSLMIPLLGFDTGIIGAILMWIGLGFYLKLNY